MSNVNVAAEIAGIKKAININTAVSAMIAKKIWLYGSNRYLLPVALVLLVLVILYWKSSTAVLGTIFLTLAGIGIVYFIVSLCVIGMTNEGEVDDTKEVS